MEGCFKCIPYTATEGKVKKGRQEGSADGRRETVTVAPTLSLGVVAGDGASATMGSLPCTQIQDKELSPPS